MNQDAERQQYSTAFKEARTILEVNPIIRGKTANETILWLNNKHGITNEAKKLVKSTVYNTIASANTGKSPKMKGPIARIPKELVEVVVHTLKFAMWVLLVNSEVAKWKGWLMMPVSPLAPNLKVSSLRNLCGGRYRMNCLNSFRLLTNWVLTMLGRSGLLTRTSSSGWLVNAKLNLIATGLCIGQEVQDADEILVSELNFQSANVKRWIQNMDETHHDLSVTGDRCGSRSVMYHNPPLQCSSKRGVVSSRHVTDVFATSAAGKSISPMYIFDSGAKIEDKFCVKMQWLHGLPTVNGRFGCPLIVKSSSFYAVRTRGWMDNSLLKSNVDDVILPLFPNISKHASFDTTTGKFGCCS